MPSILNLQPGMTLPAAESVLSAIQPKLAEQYVMTNNPIKNGTPTSEYILAQSSDAKGQSTIWLRFSLLSGALETINYQRDFMNSSDYPSLSGITQTLVGKFGPYSMKQFQTYVWQYNHAGKLLPGGIPAFASSPSNPHCTDNDYMGEQGNANNEINHDGLEILAEMYSACDIAYQFDPISGDGISVSSFTEDLVSYKLLTDEAGALVSALQNMAQQKAQQEQEKAAQNKPSL
jgi:hypothetical protein